MESDNPDSNATPVVDQEKQTRSPSEPLKFKPTAEPLGPVTRVKLDRSQRSKTKSSKKSPFKDRGLFEDTDTLVQIRESFGKPIVFSLLAVGLVFLIYQLSRPSDNTAELEAKLRPILTEADKLILDISVDDKPELEKRTALANQLLDFTESPDAMDRGAELELRSLTGWNIRNIESQVDDVESRQQMETSSREFINSRNKTVSNLAKGGLMLNRVHKYLDSPQQQFFPELLDQFKLISNFARDDLQTARDLFRVAASFDSRELRDEASQMFRTINLACSVSHNQDIAAVANEARLRLSNTSTLLDDLKQLVSSDNKIEIETVRKRIKQDIQKETISVAAMEAVLDFFDILVRRNATRATSVLMRDVSGSIYYLDPGIERDAIKQRFDEAQKRINQIGSVFRFEGLYSIDGRAISRSTFEKQPKMIVFWSPENTKSIELIERISEKTKEFVQRKVKIIAISAIDDNQAARDRIANISNDSRGIEFYTLLKEKTQSQAFLSRFPIPNLPYWVLLSHDDKIRALNVAPGIIEVGDLY